MLRFLPATIDDLPALGLLRNDPEMVQYFNVPRLISDSEIEDRFSVVDNQDTRLIIVGKVGDHLVSMIKFDLEEGAAVVSIAVHHNWREKGIGAETMAAGIDALKRSPLKTGKLEAMVNKANEPSRHLFEACDFILTSEEDAYFRFTRDLS